MKPDGTRWGRNPLRRMFVLLPGSGRLLQIIWPFLVIVLVLLLLANESMSILSAARAYSEGESLWSKGQKRAMFHLMRYSETHSEDDYRGYREAISVPLGDEKARVELEKPDPNYTVVWQGFIEGRNHPDDIPGLIMLFRRFRRLDFMAAVIDLWAEGDRHIAELTRIADQLHARIASGQTSLDSVLPFRDRILDIDTRLTPLTDRFSSTLGEATRKTQFILLLANLAVAGTLVPVGIYLSYLMVRRREEAERALKLSEERFNLAVTGSNDGLWDWNIETGEVYYSPRFKQLLGYSAREMGDDVEAFNSRLHPEDRPAHEQAIDGHLQRGGPFDIEMRLQNKAGEYRWFHFRGQALRTPEGRAMRMAGAMTDTTDRRLTAAELFAEKERAQVTLASIADGVITTDTDGHVEYLNPVAEALTGWTSPSARGRPLQVIANTVDETTRKITPNPVEMVLREERTIQVPATMLLMRSDGSEIPIVQSAAPTRARTGKSIGAAACTIGISEPSLRISSMVAGTWMVRSSRSTISTGLGVILRVVSSTVLTMTWSGRPRAEGLVQPVSASATGLRYSTWPSVSVVITPSAMDARVTWARSFSANSSAAVSRRSVVSVIAPAMRIARPSGVRSACPRKWNQRYSPALFCSRISMSKGPPRCRCPSIACSWAGLSSGCRRELNAATSSPISRAE